MATQETSIIAQNSTEELASYLVSVADKLQAQVDDVSNNMNKKLEEMTKRIDTLERSLKQMEESPSTTTTTTTTNNTEES